MPAGGLEEAEIQTNWLEFALRIVISSDLIQNHQQIGRWLHSPGPSRMPPRNSAAAHHFDVSTFPITHPASGENRSGNQLGSETNKP